LICTVSDQFEMQEGKIEQRLVSATLNAAIKPMHGKQGRRHLTLGREEDDRIRTLSSCANSFWLWRSACLVFKASYLSVDAAELSTRILARLA
jgi:hypothetical protein